MKQKNYENACHLLKNGSYFYHDRLTCLIKNVYDLVSDDQIFGVFLKNDERHIGLQLSMYLILIKIIATML